MKALRDLYLWSFVLTILACKEPFSPAVKMLPNNLLVVEGMINTGADSTFITLSRATVLEQKNGMLAENGASINIESDVSESYALKELGKGAYAIGPSNLSQTKKYRLRIKTKDGKTYLSDFVESKVSPPIDSITWEAKADGLQLYSHTHDEQNKSRYYRWEYTDTWQFNAAFFSTSVTNGKEVVDRDIVKDNIFTCWATSKSNTVMLGTSVRLAKDQINKSPLYFIASDAEKLSVKYSVLVKQQVLTKEGFDFWEKLKKNTEDLGSIFDAQPSEIGGNIHNITDPNEPVIGFISAGTTQQKRIFIAKTQLPDKWVASYPYLCYDPDSIYIVNPRTGSRDEDKYFQTRLFVPLTPFIIDGEIKGHMRSTKECADCTIRGSNRRPIFWQ